MFRNKSRALPKAILKRLIAVAQRKYPAEKVIKNGYFLDVYQGKFRAGDIAIEKGFIVGVLDEYEGRETVDAMGAYIVPGFIDAHVHIESSLLVPSQFERLVLPHGTTTVIWDPHEIANVEGKAGIEWALREIRTLLLDVFMMLPSCVPALSPELGLDSSGAVLTAKDLLSFLGNERVLGLAEMMNFPGVLSSDPEVIDKLSYFRRMPCDGHCPALSKYELNAYVSAGISSDHEVTMLEEAREKLTKGLYILIREGSCAKNADALLPILDAYTSSVVAFCTDDRHPLDVEKEGHIDFIVNKALKRGCLPEDVFRAASFAATNIYGLRDRGVVAPGFLADLCIVKPNEASRWQSGMKIKAVYKRGKLVEPSLFSQTKSLPVASPASRMQLNSFYLSVFKISSSKSQSARVRVIEIIPNEIITRAVEETLLVSEGELKTDLSKDILKIAVFERHLGVGTYTVGFVKGFNLKRGAIASTINHDSHQLIVVGASDEAMYQAVKSLKEMKGGIVVVDGANITALPLPIAGLMTEASSETVIEKMDALKKAAHALGCQLDEPFLQLAFLALPVIPELKITHRGLIDVLQFKKVSVIIES